MSTFDQKLVDLIVNECEFRRTEGWLIKKTVMGVSGYQQSCGPLTAVVLKSHGQSAIKDNSNTGRYRYYNTSFVRAKVLKFAAEILVVDKGWIYGFQKGISTRTKRPDVPGYMTDSALTHLDVGTYTEGFWTGREVGRRLSEPAFDKKPATKKLGEALRRAYKSGLSREDIRIVVDEYMAETILNQ